MPNCNKCGRTIPDKSLFCCFCGAVVDEEMGEVPDSEKEEESGSSFEFIPMEITENVKSTLHVQPRRSNSAQKNGKKSAAARKNGQEITNGQTPYQVIGDNDSLLWIIVLVFAFFCILGLCMYYVHLESEKTSKEEEAIQRREEAIQRGELIRIGMSASSLDDLYYADVYEYFDDLGFKNIWVVADNDIIFGILTHYGEVEEINIDGKKSWDDTDAFDPNVKIVIKYHSDGRDETEIAERKAKKEMEMNQEILAITLRQRKLH